MKYKINDYNNFCRVFQLPQIFPDGYCFNGGITCEFKMVDWFNPVNDEEDVKLIAAGKLDKIINSLSEFIRRKTYYESDFNYIVICDFGLTFKIQKEIKK